MVGWFVVNEGGCDENGGTCLHQGGRSKRKKDQESATPLITTTRVHDPSPTATTPPRPPPSTLTCSSLYSHSRVSVATWSLRLRPVCSFPPTGPISSVRRRSLAVWMSSSPCLMINEPPRHSEATWGGWGVAVGVSVGLSGGWVMAELSDGELGLLRLADYSRPPVGSKR